MFRQIRYFYEWAEEWIAIIGAVGSPFFMIGCLVYLTYKAIAGGS